MTFAKPHPAHGLLLSTLDNPSEAPGCKQAVFSAAGGIAAAFDERSWRTPNGRTDSTVTET